MSYILEALRKAERERSLGQTPDLRTLHNAPVALRRRLWPWLLTVALLLNVAVLALLWLPGRESALTVPAPAASAPPAVITPPVPVPAPAPVAVLPPAPVLPAPAPAPSPAPRLSQQESAPVPSPAPLPLSSSTLPPLNLDVHVYSEQPDKRFVLINGRRYREGDWLDAGPLVERIVAGGVLLRHKSRQFMLPVPR